MVRMSKGWVHYSKKGITEESQKSIQEDQEIVDDGNEDKTIREKITGNQERVNALEKERK